MGWMATTTGSETGNGKKREGVIVSYAPATGEALGEVPIASREHVKQAVQRARVAQEVWAQLPIEECCERILRWRDAIVDDAELIVDLLCKECGKPRTEALAHEVVVTADLAT